MLKILSSFHALQFRQLSDVYEDSNCQLGHMRYRNEHEAQQLLMAEQDLYSYLKEFYKMQGAYCAVWQEGDMYISALRIEPFRDGLLLSGLETIPHMRRRGYGLQLVKAVLEDIRSRTTLPVYSHIDKSNVASLFLHEKAGFVRIYDQATFLDGSVQNSAYTLKF